MATWDGNNYYYSGQGVVLLGSRNADGTPAGLTEIGNVSSLVITVETSVLEHKESQTGQRAIDLRLTTETKCKLAITMENFIASNLADTLRGSRVTVAAGAVVGEASKGYLGKVSTLKRTSASSVVVKRGAASLVAYVADGTAYDYKVNAEAGSILINSGQRSEEHTSELQSR